MPLDTNVISNNLMDMIIDILVDKLIFEELPPEELKEQASAGLIRGGKLQDDPTVGQINLLVHPGNDVWPNILFDHHVVNGLNLDHTYEIGRRVPSQFHMLRFRTQLVMFFEDEFDRVVAQQKAQAVLFRAVHAITILNDGNFRTIPRDDFGFKPHLVQCADYYIREGGGPGTFIWRGEIKLEFLCSFEANANL